MAGNDHALAGRFGAYSRWVESGPAEWRDGRSRWEGLYAAPLPLSRMRLPRADPPTHPRDRDPPRPPREPRRPAGGGPFWRVRGRI